MQSARGHKTRLLVGIAMSGAAFMTPLIATATVTPNLSPNVGSAHVLWTKDHYTSDAQTDPNQLLYHGGTVETKPAVYLVFWGLRMGQGILGHGGLVHLHEPDCGNLPTRFLRLRRREFVGRGTDAVLPGRGDRLGRLQRSSRRAVRSEPIKHVEGHLG